VTLNLSSVSCFSAFYAAVSSFMLPVFLFWLLVWLPVHFTAQKRRLLITFTVHSTARVAHFIDMTRNMIIFRLCFRNPDSHQHVTDDG
jgi:hypothetical protein